MAARLSISEAIAAGIEIPPLNEPAKLLKKRAKLTGAFDCADTLGQVLNMVKIYGWVRDFRFHPSRKWELDIAWPELMIAVEVDGGQFIEGGGRHQRGKGYEADIEKLNEAMLLEWSVLRVTPAHVKDGRALQWIERMLKQNERTL
jgi:hypothetical protein